MFSAFRETIASLKSSTYGATILTKPFRWVLWYWTKYLILLASIPMVISIFIITWYLPQAPRFITANFPAGSVTVKNHLLSTTIKEPYKTGNQDFALIINTAGGTGDLASVSGGMLFLKDQLVVKSPGTGQLQSQDYKQIPDFSFNRDQLAKWINSNSFKLWLILFAAVLVIGLVTAATGWVFRLALYGFCGLLFWLMGRYLLKKSLTFIQALAVALYASVPQLVISLVLSLVFSDLLNLLVILLFTYLSINWIRNLPPAPAAKNS